MLPDGFYIGHFSNETDITGCSVLLCPENTLGGISVQGGAICTYNTEILTPLSLRSSVNAVYLTGGSAFGLPSVKAVQDFLYNRHGTSLIPIVPALSLFDFRIGKAKAPTYEEAFRACQNISLDIKCRGNIGAGMGATVGKLRGIKWAMKGGLGFASHQLNNGIIISALIVVNAFGDIVDTSGSIIAGARNRSGMINSEKYIKDKEIAYLENRENTTIGVVITNAKLNKAELNKVAQMAHTGLARSVVPCWTNNDGDVIICVSSNEIDVDFNLIGILAGSLTREAIVDGIKSAKSVAEIPAYEEFSKDTHAI